MGLPAGAAAPGQPDGIRGHIQPDDGAWRARLSRAVAGATVSAAYQPIVDLARGNVVGYEALARFSDPEWTNPETWFRTAAAHGMAAGLEAAALRAALAHRASLPPNCFLSVNLTPRLLSEPQVRHELLGQGHLGGVVVELTEQTPIDSYEQLQPFLDQCRSAGALIAVDDAGSGYAGLQHLINLRPSIIKLDRHFVDGIDTDEAKRALVVMLGAFADRLDAWLLAEGIERAEELDVLVNLGVPLAQGYLLGRPGPPWPALAAPAASQLAGRGVRDSGRPTLRGLLEIGPSSTDLDGARALLATDPKLETVVIVGADGRPTALADVESVAYGLTVEPLVANVDTPLADAARRALTRPRRVRFHPLVCIDSAGRYLGVVPMERVIERLADANDEILL